MMIRKTSSNKNMYGSGFNSEDWYLFRNILLPFLHAQDLNAVAIPEVPEHLKSHLFLQALKAFKDTSDKQFLDQAGQLLVPSATESFGWYLIVTKA